VLRALAKEPRTLECFFQEVAPASKDNLHFAAAVTRLQRELTDQDAREWRARGLVERMALILQGALLVQHGHPAVADAFCATRLAGDWGRAFGTLPAGVNAPVIIERSRPKF